MTLPANTAIRFETEGMPALYYAADTASTTSQSLYLRMLFLVLICTVAGPLLLGLAPLSPKRAALFRYASATSLFASLLVTGRIRESRKEREWYGGRAVAESVKTSAWRYAMAAEPYTSVSIAEMDKLFLANLREMLKDAKELNYSAGGDFNSKPQITDTMRSLRRQSWQERMQVYLEQRVHDQRRWYSTKSKHSNQLENVFFALILAFQLLATLVSLAFAVWPQATINMTGTITSSTAALLVWLQVKRYQETSQSYAVTSHELGFVEETSKHVKSEDEFSSFVSDSENAMSREHTLWVARRRS